MSLPIAMPFPPRSTEDTIKKLEEVISVTPSMCTDLGVFLGAAFPGREVEAQQFAESLELYLNHNTRKYMETVKNPPPMPVGYSPFDPIEHLASLCKRRDQLQAQLDAFNEMVDHAKDKIGEDGQEMMRAQVNLSGLPQQLEDLNEQISNFQRQMEAQAK